MMAVCHCHPSRSVHGLVVNRRATMRRRLREVEGGHRRRHGRQSVRRELRILAVVERMVRGVHRSDMSYRMRRGMRERMVKRSRGWECDGAWMVRV